MLTMVIGGSGFLGACVVEELVMHGVEPVVSIDLSPLPACLRDVNERIEAVTCDITNYEELLRLFEGYKPNVIVHTASLLSIESRNDPRRAYKVNIDGWANVLEAARQVGTKRIVYASSIAVYGSVDVPRIHEDVPRRPTSTYGITKLAAEHLGERYQDSYGIDFVALRPCHIFGPGRARGNMVVASLILDALSGKIAKILHGDQLYEVIHVKDCAAAFALAATKPHVEYRYFNVGQGYQISLSQLAEIVRDHVPRAKVEVYPGEDPTRPPRPPLDITRASTYLGWSPRYSISDAIRDFIESVRWRGS